MIRGISFYPLQVQVQDFWKAKSSSSNDALYFLIGIGAVVLILIIVNLIKKKYNVPSLTGAPRPATSPQRFSGLSLRRLAANFGLDRQQTKMLDFVLKNDGVVDVGRAVSTPVLLDRHFKRAYRAITRSSGGDEETQDRLAVLFSTRNILESGADSGNIKSTHQIPDNTSAVFSVNGESYPVRVFSAKGEHLLVEPPRNALGNKVRLSRGSKVILSFFTKSSKGFSVESRVLGSTESHTGPVLQLVHSGQIQRLSHRRFRRREAVIAAQLYFVYIENKRMVVDKRRLAGNILDLSVGGCSIKTNAPVSSGARLKIEFFQGNTPVAALGQVLRTNRSGVSTIIHIKFLKVPRRSLNAINAYVFEYAD